MADWKDLADLMFPDVDQTIADLEKKYPPRTNATCSRFAPSPTGFLHIGGVFSALVSWRFVQQYNGTFILRIEDTDQKRKIDGAVESLLNSMKTFGITIDEGNLGANGEDVGNYGPYTQSERKELYHIFAKELVAKGLAYPCWMTNEEIDNIRDQQQKSKIMPGIYGNYSVYRNIDVDGLIQKVKENPDYIVRFRSHGNTQKKIVFEDVLRGKVNMGDNYNDIVLIKSDGLPTYHLAHIVDDYLMRVSHIIRAEEWLTSVPLHLQLFEAFNLPAPKYCHLAQILKIDEETGKKRKLSKRKDPEADVEYFFQNAYSTQGILDYLYTIMDSGFEEWQKANPDKSFLDRDFVLENMNKSGALFDLTKMESVNNEYLSRISTEQLFNETIEWAEKYNTELANLMKEDVDYTKSALDIERHTPKDPKRFTTFKDVDTQLRFFFDSEYEKLIESVKLKIKSGDEEFQKFTEFDMGIVSSFLDEYLGVLDLDLTVEEWFSQLKEIGKKHGFAGNNAEFKEGGYIGKVGDLAMIIRVGLCASTKTPDLFSVMKVMGKSRIEKR
ncbi:MAG TPA: glutamate--tRNA ligase, partial [Candidatus Absconditabacterales bacterium]|nr:glutamate--tRNA ligase [Candidatus Absconditabacterales bacterium]